MARGKSFLRGESHRQIQVKPLLKGRLDKSSTADSLFTNNVQPYTSIVHDELHAMHVIGGMVSVITLHGYMTSSERKRRIVAV
jgi:hypothetical protein